MSSSTPFSIAKISKLARIKVTSEDVENLSNDLQGILKFIETLDELDLEQVTPFFGLNPLESDIDLSPKRADEVRASEDRQSILKNSPKTDGEHYLVPPVFE
ncbi:MAG: Asp-tRNA(Asn)/Glu-tRNA(Gln) amidotransferase subunit GatC [Planctomycetota bacterium]